MLKYDGVKPRLPPALAAGHRLGLGRWDVARQRCPALRSSWPDLRPMMFLAGLLVVRRRFVFRAAARRAPPCQLRRYSRFLSPADECCPAWAGP